MNALPEGFELHPRYLDPDAQNALLKEVRDIVAKAPLYVPTMPRTGKPLSVRMTNCGELGWLTDKEVGYRYQTTHPETGKKWPAIPPSLISIWNALSGFSNEPQACLINYYGPDAKMGLHQDKDEEDFSAPVVSVSLGDDCLFRIGGTNRKDPTKSVRLQSGDVMVMGGAGRLNFHGVDRIYPGTSALLKREGRINLTLRRVRSGC